MFGEQNIFWNSCKSNCCHKVQFILGFVLSNLLLKYIPKLTVVNVILRSSIYLVNGEETRRDVNTIWMESKILDMILHGNYVCEHKCCNILHTNLIFMESLYFLGIGRSVLFALPLALRTSNNCLWELIYDTIQWTCCWGHRHLCGT